MKNIIKSILFTIILIFINLLIFFSSNIFINNIYYGLHTLGILIFTIISYLVNKYLLQKNLTNNKKFLAEKISKYIIYTLILSVLIILTSNFLDSLKPLKPLKPLNLDNNIRVTCMMLVTQTYITYKILGFLSGFIALILFFNRKKISNLYFYIMFIFFILIFLVFSVNSKKIGGSGCGNETFINIKLY